ncbi:hypothetical protein [Streptococcus agalactiae]|uniref:hypothetical protein n=1 Tax=Streptococcus agalactiae TaxID=1311 RepID=UPI001C94CFF0|nr:hypothetical protein [Streptococcus agalactiae]MBY5050948.1 hypothetical protein [Streptococcus agalactiae]
MAITDSTLSYYHYYKRKKKQQSICLSNIAEEIHNLVSKPSIIQEEQVLLMRVTNYLCRSFVFPYQSMYHELYEIAKLAPWLFDKLCAYESGKRKPYFGERTSNVLPTKLDILTQADCLFPTLKEIRRPKW